MGPIIGDSNPRLQSSRSHRRTRSPAYRWGPSWDSWQRPRRMRQMHGTSSIYLSIYLSFCIYIYCNISGVICTYIWVILKMSLKQWFFQIPDLEHLSEHQPSFRNLRGWDTGYELYVQLSDDSHLHPIPTYRGFLKWGPTSSKSLKHFSRRKFRSQTSDNMIQYGQMKRRDGKSQREEKTRREKMRRERVRRKKLRCTKR